MKNKHSKGELKHWCDNCCCCDCRQTKKEKLACKRNRKESPKPFLFEEYQNSMINRKLPSEKIYITSQSIDMTDDNREFLMELRNRSRKAMVKRSETIKKESDK